MFCIVSCIMFCTMLSVMLCIMFCVMLCIMFCVMLCIMFGIVRQNVFATVLLSAMGLHGLMRSTSAASRSAASLRSWCQGRACWEAAGVPCGLSSTNGLVGVTCTGGGEPDIRA